MNSLAPYASLRLQPMGVRNAGEGDQRKPDGWKEKYEYGTRSLVESVFGAVKVKFGGTLRSRRDNRRAVQTPLKVVIYNAERANYLSWFNL